MNFLIQVENLFSVNNNGTNVETRLVNEHLYKVLSGTSFVVLDITHLSEFRADAHPSMAGGKKHNDCMHWCLPGLTDTWNDLFIAHLYSIRNRNWCLAYSFSTHRKENCSYVSLVLLRMCFDDFDLSVQNIG